VTVMWSQSSVKQCHFLSKLAVILTPQEGEMAMLWEDPRRDSQKVATWLVVNEIYSIDGRPSHTQCWRDCPHSNLGVHCSSELNGDSELSLTRKGFPERPLACDMTASHLSSVHPNSSGSQDPSRSVLCTSR
jgi:hypothetical protein